MHATQMSALINACKDHDEVRIVTCALHIAAMAARERKQDTAIAIRHLVDEHQGREQAEKEYKRQRLTMATQIIAGLAANPGGPFQANDRSGWSITNCDENQVAGVAIGLAEALLMANASAPIPHDAKESNPAGDRPSVARSESTGLDGQPLVDSTYVPDLGRCDFDDECDYCKNPSGGSYARLIHNAMDVTETDFYICGQCASSRGWLPIPEVSGPPSGGSTAPRYLTASSDSKQNPDGTYSDAEAM